MTDAAVSIGVDWGTTSFRAYRLGADGAMLEGRRAEAGILAIDDDAFEDALEQLVGDWLDAEPGIPVVLSGMITSRQGWVETPYLACPASVDDLAGALTPVTLARGRVIHMAPGLSMRGADNVPDVMRGEEVQILGAADRIGGENTTVCLPGTHSKWARVAGRQVTMFATHMTGEVFDALRRHTILGREIEHAAWDDDAFLDGVARSGQGGGLLHHLFGVRAAGLMGDLTPETAGAFLSGLVIGHEVRAAENDGGTVHLIGEPALVALYIKALAVIGRVGEEVETGAAARGLHMIALSLSGGSDR